MISVYEMVNSALAGIGRRDRMDNEAPEKMKTQLGLQEWLSSAAEVDRHVPNVEPVPSVTVMELTRL